MDRKRRRRIVSPSHSRVNGGDALQLDPRGTKHASGKMLL